MKLHFSLISHNCARLRQLAALVWGLAVVLQPLPVSAATSVTVVGLFPGKAVVVRGAGGSSRGG